MTFAIAAIWTAVLLAAVLPLAWTAVWLPFHGSGAAAPLFGPTTVANLAQETLRSFALAIAAGSAAFVAGVAAALFLGKSDMPWKGPLLVLLCTPLALPSSLYAAAWRDLMLTLGFSADFMNGFLGPFFVATLLYLPIPMLLTLFYLRTLPPSPEEASLLWGGWRQTVRRVTLPLLLPALALAAILLFVLLLSEVELPLFFGYGVLAGESFVRFAGFFDATGAAVAALPLLGAALLTIFTERRFVKEAAKMPKITARRTLLLPLGKGRIPLALLFALLAFVIVVAPLGGLFFDAGGWRGLLASLRRAEEALGWSLLLSASSATLVTALGYLAAALFMAGAGRFARGLDPTLIFLFAVPGVLLAVAFTALWNPLFPGLFESVVPFLAVVTAHLGAVGHRIALAGFGTLPSDFVEAARLAGASTAATHRYIYLPLLKNSLLAAWSVAYLFAFRDTATAALLLPPGVETLPMRLLTAMANGSPRTIAGLGLVTTAAAILPPALVWLLAVRRRA